MFKIFKCNFFNFIKKRKKCLISILIIGMVLFFISNFVIRAINGAIYDAVEIQTKSLGAKCVNKAISEVLSGQITYDDLVKITTDNKGNITLLQANSVEISALSKNLALKTEEIIKHTGKNGVFIPLGTLTGVPLFVGVGPKLNLNATPVGAVTCSFFSEFQSAGINQSIHKIYITVKVNIGVVMPVFSQRYLVEQQVLAAESIIVGQVPEVYLYSDNLDTLLNFVPF